MARLILFAWANFGIKYFQLNGNAIFPSSYSLQYNKKFTIWKCCFITFYNSTLNQQLLLHLYCTFNTFLNIFYNVYFFKTYTTPWVQVCSLKLVFWKKSCSLFANISAPILLATIKEIKFPRNYNVANGNIKNFCKIRRFELIRCWIDIFYYHYANWAVGNYLVKVDAELFLITNSLIIYWASNSLTRCSHVANG